MKQKLKDSLKTKKTILTSKKKEIDPTSINYLPRPKIFKLGQNIQPKKDLSRFIKLPKFIRIQRQRKILTKKLKIPPVLKLLELTASAKENCEKSKNLFSEEIMSSNLSKFCIHGINKVTNFVRKKKVKLVLIARDVNPLELIIWLPTLCKKFETDYLIVGSKSRLGKLVNKKKTSCVALIKK
jgi:large subunit ribosomal protein L7Ae